ncbi:uncharacterized protein ACA1_252190 [Acanthamoeba castellanii str. Neff]|uniref:Uncharacterized protein n=1 Tax=Acanthamoeba castellanii (strain ATCC 30010 / Neff) TaxID=1257118 RepID=L8HAS0_ACACF|nr:uncharacterized protein ACA1_252190 [Acanthamoeba castellanii str. Neff]ELR22295.1 hypothetical protein ACA1_252190 [Acanthamoeba castellanii str. Neff]
MSQEKKGSSKRKRPETESSEDEGEEVGREDELELEDPTSPIDATGLALPPTADILEVPGNKRSLDDLLRELLKSAGVDDQFDAMARGQQPLFTAPVMVPTMADFAGIAAAIAALPGAVAAVVPGAVAAAMAPVAARVDNIRIRSYNKRQRTIHQAHGVQAGNGAGLPGMPALPAGGPASLAVAAAVAAAPLAVGAVPPAGAFPATDATVGGMGHAELHILSIIYNETFDVLAGDNLGQRRDKFGAGCVNKNPTEASSINM